MFAISPLCGVAAAQAYPPVQPGRDAAHLALSPAAERWVREHPGPRGLGAMDTVTPSGWYVTVDGVVHVPMVTDTWPSPVGTDEPVLGYGLALRLGRSIGRFGAGLHVDGARYVFPQVSSTGGDEGATALFAGGELSAVFRNPQQIQVVAGVTLGATVVIPSTPLGPPGASSADARLLPAAALSLAIEGRAYRGGVMLQTALASAIAGEDLEAPSVDFVLFAGFRLRRWRLQP